MAETKKVTQKEMYNSILEIEQLTDEQRDFIKKKIEQLDKKSGKASTKKSAEHQKLEDTILDVLGNEPNRLFSCSELVAIIGGDASTQRLTPRLKALVDEEKIKVQTEKRKNIYQISAE